MLLGKHSRSKRLQRCHRVSATRALPQGGEEQQTQGTQTDWTTFLLVLAQMGAVMGTLTDGLHSSAGLQVYDLGAIQLGNLHTDLAVPPLLALFYVVLGSLVILGDRVFASDPATQEAQRRSDDVAFVFLCFGLLAANTHFSAVLYQQGTPFSQMSLILGSGALLNWFLLDRTKQGLILSVVCAIGAPAAELILLHFIPLWHYPKADILNGTFVSWVPWMYFGYIPAVANLARFLWSFCKGTWMRTFNSDDVPGGFEHLISEDNTFLASPASYEMIDEDTHM